MEFGKSVYKGVADYGKFTSTIQFYIFSAIAVVMVFIGLYLIIKKQTGRDTVGKIIQVDCNRIYMNNGYHYECTLKIEYNVGSTPYTSVINVSSATTYYNGQNVDISYEIDNPMKIKIKQISSKIIGIIVIVIALIIVGGSYFTKCITQRYEVAAAAKGSANIVSMFRQK